MKILATFNLYSFKVSRNSRTRSRDATVFEVHQSLFFIVNRFLFEFLPYFKVIKYGHKHGNATSSCQKNTFLEEKFFNVGY